MKRILVGIVLAGAGLSFGCGNQETGPSVLPDSSPNASGATTATGSTTDMKTAKRNFTAPLSGGEEVPPVDSKGTGVAKFQLSKDGSALSYKLNVANIDNVLQAHIHMAPAGTNGGVVAFLFGFAPGGVTVNGTLAQGVLTDADLINALAGQTIADLVAAMQSGNTYVNVHTVAHPPGEIRGQIK